MSKNTPMYEDHIRLGAKIVEFAGYKLPIQYSSLIKEHLAVRNDVGVFDISHMGEILIEGECRKFVNYLICNDVTNLKIGKMKYSPMLNEEGGIVDDLLVYALNEKQFLLIVNGANIAKDLQWIIDHKKYRVHISDLSDSYAQIAIQGPHSKQHLLELLKEEDLPSKYYSFKENVEILNHKLLISKNGYTGEDGYELFGDGDSIKEVFNYLVDHGVSPCGLGCRDTLRIEAGMPLYGHEMSDEISPLDTSLEMFTKLDKLKFIGKDALKNKNKVRVGLKNLDGGIIREDMPIYDGFEKVGCTTSGTFLPYLNGSYAMAIIRRKVALPGTQLRVKIRDKCTTVEIVELPFYKREK
ncbi:MAG: glycine cleavage system aminomethyltransferase GcvT [Spirochaetaceae bacterium]|nr:glycine cleavage system aminomethyltransferase GcvT [Spirochaetaceae bacterium]